MTVTKECAIVGGGLAGLVGYATLRHGGITPAEIAVFGTDPDPAGQWRVRAAAIRQRRMRSESDGHVERAAGPCLPEDEVGVGRGDVEARPENTPRCLGRHRDQGPGDLVEVIEGQRHPTAHREQYSEVSAAGRTARPRAATVPRGWPPSA